MNKTALWCKIFNYFLYLTSAETFKIKGRYNPLLKKEEIVLVPLYLMLFESFAPTLANKNVKMLDI